MPKEQKKFNKERRGGFDFLCSKSRMATNDVWTFLEDKHIKVSR